MHKQKMERFNEPLKKCPFILERRTYTIPEIQDILCVGRTAVYAVVRTGKFKVVRIGKNIQISKKSFDEWLDGQEGGE